MQQHVTALAVLFIVLGALGLIGFLVVVLVFGGAAGIVSLAAGGEPEAAIAVPIVGTVGAAIALFILIVSLPDIVVGIGLLGFRPWARILGIVLSILGLLHFPLGTLVGVYGLWVLFNPETEALFRSMPPGQRPF
jgi:hypothetical protein